MVDILLDIDITSAYEMESIALDISELFPIVEVPMENGCETEEFCLNGGECEMKEGSPSCKCGPEFSGKNCQVTKEEAKKLKKLTNIIFDNLASSSCEIPEDCLSKSNTLKEMAYQSVNTEFDIGSATKRDDAIS